MVVVGVWGCSCITSRGNLSGISDWCWPVVVLLPLCGLARPYLYPWLAKGLVFVFHGHIGSGLGAKGLWFVDSPLCMMSAL